MDKLEQYIKENRSLLDTEDLSDEAKNNIKKMFVSQKKKLFYKRIYQAAAIFVVLMGSVLLWNTHKTKDFGENAIINQYAEQQYLNKEEAYYARLINEKIQGIENETIKKENRMYFNSFIKQLKTIDRQYEICKKQIDQYGYSDEYVQQLIYIYQLKLSVLEMLQAEMKKINKRNRTKSDENEKIRIY